MINSSKGMMLATIDDVKELILWAKQEKIKEIKIGNLHFVISDVAITEQYLQSQPEELKDNESTSLSSKTMVDTLEQEPKEIEEDLYWSSRS